MKQSLFDAVGGLPTLQKVHKIFYDKVYAHPWLDPFFEGHSQEALCKRWLTIDRAFWKQVMNDSLASFSQIDLKYERPLIIENPEPQTDRFDIIAVTGQSHIMPDRRLA